jgi:hypothetical protein
LPTALERSGDFTQSLNALGTPLRVIDPRTGSPFPDNTIPTDRISPQAAALLAYYPTPNLDPSGRYNYQLPLTTDAQQTNVQARITEGFNRNNQLMWNFAYQRGTTATENLFGFNDQTQVSGVDTTVNWNHRLTQFFPFAPRITLPS